MKQAKDEAKEEIEKYRAEREKQFREFEAKKMGSKEDIQTKIDVDTLKKIAEIESQVQNMRNPVRYLYL